MEKVKFYLTAFAFGALTLMNVACGNDDDKQVCEKYSPTCEEALQATLCCEGTTSCKYSYNGVEYPNTDEGRAELAEILCPVANEATLKEVRTVLKEKTLKLMEAARTAAL